MDEKEKKACSKCGRHPQILLHTTEGVICADCFLSPETVEDRLQKGKRLLPLPEKRGPYRLDKMIAWLAFLIAVVIGFAAFFLWKVGR